MTPELYREIMRTYSDKQSRALRLSDMRREEIYSRIPEIQSIDESLMSFNISLVKIMQDPDTQKRKSKTEKLKNRISDMLSKKNYLLLRNGYPENYIEDVYECPLCRDTGFIENEPCSCFKSAIRQKLYSDSSLKSENDSESFSSFSLEYYSDAPDPRLKTSVRKYMENVLNICKSFAENPIGNLLFTGHTGLGKSFLCHSIAKELLDKNTDVVCDSAFMLFDRLLNRRFGRETDDEYKNSVFNCSLLIIDDLGAENINSAANAEFFNLLNYRLTSRKPTIISSNLSMTDIKQTYSERIFSRIMGEYKIIPFFGEDIRILKRKRS